MTNRNAGGLLLIVILAALLAVLIWFMLSYEELPVTAPSSSGVGSSSSAAPTVSTSLPPSSTDAPFTTGSSFTVPASSASTSTSDPPASSAVRTDALHTDPAKTSSYFVLSSSTSASSTAASSTSAHSSAAPTVPASSSAPVTTQSHLSFEASLGYNEQSASLYAQYAAAHPGLDSQTVVKEVNIGLYRPFYTDTEPVDDPNSILVLVNKYHYLPSDYAPKDLVDLKYRHPDRTEKGRVTLRAEAAAAFDKLCEAAMEEGFTILGFSGYRSYSYQQSIYSSYCKSDPQSVVDTYSARAGYSEHQTGLAIDVCTDKYAYNRFGNSPEYQWAKDNIHKYGFIIHYTQTNTDLTGYKNEEWHFRYVGVEAATFMYEHGLVIDEYIALYADNV